MTLAVKSVSIQSYQPQNTNRNNLVKADSIQKMTKEPSFGMSTGNKILAVLTLLMGLGIVFVIGNNAHVFDQLLKDLYITK